MTPQHDVETIVANLDRTMAAITGIFAEAVTMLVEIEQKVSGLHEPYAEFVRWRRGRTAFRAERAEELRRELVELLREELTDPIK
jgi:hypothetical protein